MEYLLNIHMAQENSRKNNTLSDFVLPSRVNQNWLYSGIDSPELCPDLLHFQQYACPVQYQYNSRGFRDSEWPSDLKSAVWCLGDSFTVGLGQPFAHIWPQVLQTKTATRTVNVSMDGASNDWIARKCCELIQQVDPGVIVLQWSYLHRREESIDDINQRLWTGFYNNVRDRDWPQCPHYTQTHTLPPEIQHEIVAVHLYTPPVFSDEDRRLEHIRCSEQQDILNLVTNIQLVDSAGSTGKIVHSFIPNFAPRSVDISVITKHAGCSVGQVAQVDWARDGVHYDRHSAELFVNQLCALNLFTPQTQ